VVAEAASATLPAAILAYGREMGAGPASPFVGRERELESLISVLLKFFKPNPLLLGEAGVGKTALLEALARKIKSGQVPPALRGKRLVEISVNALLAGASFPGEMEGRFEDLLEAVRSRPEVILFIDEIHSLVATHRGGGAGSSMAELLKPVLSRNDLQLIGATTNAEYQRYIAPEEALARRFQPIQVEEPTAPVVQTILENAALQLSRHHGVEIPHKLFPALIRLCTEELPSRRFPTRLWTCWTAPAPPPPLADRRSSAPGWSNVPLQIWRASLTRTPRPSSTSAWGRWKPFLANAFWGRRRLRTPWPTPSACASTASIPGP
jgi:ATP-dependent Clp protease ATP-binding subunit ClpA